MKTKSEKLFEPVSWVLALCGLLTTFLVVRREFIQEPVVAAAESSSSNSAPVYFDEWQQALSGGIRVGSADAPVQVIEFADFECPYCARFETTVQAVRKKYPDTVAFTFAHLPLPQHGFAVTAARVAECADLQGSFEPMRTVLFQKQQVFGSTSWTELARQAKVADIRQFEACMNDPEPPARIDEGLRLADAFGVRGTPTIMVNGWMFPAPPSSADFDRFVKNIAAGRSLPEI